MADENNAQKKLEKKQAENHAKAEASFQERMRQDEQRRSNSELERIQKVSGSGLSEDAYAVREIILTARRAPRQDSYQPSLLQLGFADTTDAMSQASRFFKVLQEKGCFKETERSTNNVLTVKGPNIRLLKKELKELKQLEQSTFERFFRRLSHGFIGLNHILGFAVTVLTVISLVQGLMLRNLNRDAVSSAETPSIVVP